ncbi:MAG: trigger factor [Anaerovoracaceae bacterium]
MGKDQRKKQAKYIKKTESTLLKEETKNDDSVSKDTEHHHHHHEKHYAKKKNFKGFTIGKKQIRLQKKTIIWGMVGILAFAGAVTGITIAILNVPYMINLDKYIKVGKYTGLTIEKQAVSVTQKDVDEKIKADLEAAAKEGEVKNGNVKKDDTVDVSYSATIAGKEFEGSNADGEKVKIGSGMYIKGFEDGLVGMKPGESKTIKVKAPTNYGDEKLAGKEIVYQVTVNGITTMIQPTIEEYIKDEGDYKTVEAYKAATEKKLLKNKKEDEKTRQKSTLWSEVTAASEAKKYPEQELAAEKKKQKDQYKEYADQSGMKLSEYVKQMGMDAKAFKEQIKTSSETAVKDNMVMYKIARKENIKTSRKKINKFIDGLFARYDMTQQEYMDQNQGKTYEEVVGKEEIKNMVLLDMVQDFILEKAKVTEPKAIEKKDKKNK